MMCSPIIHSPFLTHFHIHIQNAFSVGLKQSVTKITLYSSFQPSPKRFATFMSNGRNIIKNSGSGHFDSQLVTRMSYPYMAQLRITKSWLEKKLENIDSLSAYTSQKRGKLAT